MEKFFTKGIVEKFGIKWSKSCYWFTNKIGHKNNPAMNNCRINSINNIRME